MATLILWKNKNNNINLVRSNNDALYHSSDDSYFQIKVNNNKNKYIKNIQIKDLNVLVGCDGTLLDSENVINVVTEAFNSIIKNGIDYNESKVIQNYIVSNLAKLYYPKEYTRIFIDFNVVLCINNANIYSFYFNQKGVILNRIDSDFFIAGNNDSEGYHSYLSIMEINSKLGNEIYNKYIKQVCETLNDLNELSGDSWFGYVDHEIVNTFYAKKDINKEIICQTIK